MGGQGYQHTRNSKITGRDGLSHCDARCVVVHLGFPVAARSDFRKRLRSNAADNRCAQIIIFRRHAYLRVRFICLFGA